MFGDSIRPSAISVCATGFVGKQGFGRVREWLGVLWGTELWWLIFTRTPPPSWTLHLPGALLSFTHIRPLPLFSHSCCVEVQQPGYTYTCFISPRTPPWPLPAPEFFIATLYSPFSCALFGLLFLSAYLSSNLFFRFLTALVHCEFTFLFSSVFMAFFHHLSFQSFLAIWDEESLLEHVVSLPSW